MGASDESGSQQVSGRQRRSRYSFLPAAAPRVDTRAGDEATGSAGRRRDEVMLS